MTPDCSPVANPWLRRSATRATYITLLLFTSLTQAQEVTHPAEIVFRRQAVQRLIFDSDQAIPLSVCSPSKVIDLDLMHPDFAPESEQAKCDIERDTLVVTSREKRSQTIRWMGGFNPFATYETDIASVSGRGTVGFMFRDSDRDDRMIAELVFEDGSAQQIRWKTILDGNTVAEQSWSLGAFANDHAFRFRVQMVAVGANLFIESKGRTSMIGHVDFSENIEVREKRRIARYQYALISSLDTNSSVRIREIKSAITPGTGQADIRAMTDEHGHPLLDDERLWFTVTMRGRALPHPMQGVVSLNPSVFDLRFEGLIVFDSGDGLLRNELASHIFRDTKSGQWRGWTTGFSAFGNEKRGESKAILAVSSDRDPRRGYSIMKSRSIGIEGAHEDPHCVYDQEAQKWRMLLCERAGKYRAAMWESDDWDRDFRRIAGPVEMDSTGTMLQSFDGKRYALFGSADRKVYIRNYPDLSAAGELKMVLPPWTDDHGTRIWPNVIPLPSGYPAPYIALMMDRANFPGMPKPNWTYGALYLFHGNTE
ncbi:MAG: hypothetical protein AAGG48_09785 [Planctomycetota bacterium]